MAMAIMAISLTGCGSSNTEDMPDTYEDYRKLAAESYDRQDWETALAILDEGIEKCGFDSLSQNTLSKRREYIPAGVVAVRTKFIENEYDDDGKDRSSRVSEYDESGNELTLKLKKRE